MSKEDVVNELVRLLEQSLVAQSNASKAAEMQDYMRGKFTFYGVSRPERNEILKHLKPEIKKLNLSETLSFVSRLWDFPNREMHYCAMDALQWNVKKLDSDNLSAIEHLLVTHAWWDTVDILASNVVGVILKDDAEIQAKWTERWVVHENMWLNRTAIIFQLKYRLETNTSLLSKAILMHTDSEEFFIQKAIGWSLRQYAKYNPDWVAAFVANNELKPLSKREALKHLR